MQASTVRFMNLVRHSDALLKRFAENVKAIPYCVSLLSFGQVSSSTIPRLSTSWTIAHRHQGRPENGLSWISVSPALNLLNHSFALPELASLPKHFQILRWHSADLKPALNSSSRWARKNSLLIEKQKAFEIKDKNLKFESVCCNFLIFRTGLKSRFNQLDWFEFDSTVTAICSQISCLISMFSKWLFCLNHVIFLILSKMAKFFFPT